MRYATLAKAGTAGLLATGRATCINYGNTTCLIAATTIINIIIIIIIVIMNALITFAFTITTIVI